MLVNQWTRGGRITGNDLTYVRGKYQLLYNNSDVCGRGSLDQCRKLRTNIRKYEIHNKDHRHVARGPEWLRSYWFAFVNRWKRIPKHGQWPAGRKCEFSHLCGSENCIEPGHIVFELSSTNKSRCACHLKIREFERHFRQSSSVNTEGKIDIAAVRIEWPDVRDCTHGHHGDLDQPCFVNFGSMRTNKVCIGSRPDSRACRSAPSLHLRNRHPITGDFRGDFEGRTVYFKGEKGWFVDSKYDSDDNLQWTIIGFLRNRKIVTRKLMRRAPETRYLRYTPAAKEEEEQEDEEEEEGEEEDEEEERQRRS